MLLHFIKAASRGNNVRDEYEWVPRAGEDEPRPYNSRKRQVRVATYWIGLWLSKLATIDGTEGCPAVRAT
jgi:hypothetical protein